MRTPGYHDDRYFTGILKVEFRANDQDHADHFSLPSIQ